MVQFAWLTHTCDRRRYNYMATKIQSVWRMFAMRKEFARLVKLWAASGITIQRVFRGMLVS